MLSSVASGVGERLSDAVLIERVRSGDRDGYALLYERHGPTARRFARSLVRTDADADDVVAEVFARVLMALERGKGPVGTFAPYLMSSVRHESYRVNRRGRRESTDRFESVDGDGGESAAHHDPYDRVDEADVLRVAFASLPAHQREVLWRTEVDEVSPGELADGNESTPHAVAMSAMRARRALGSAYLEQHTTTEQSDRDLDAACREARPHLVGYVRGTLGIRWRRRVEAHLDGCDRCDEARDGLGHLNRQLRIVPFLPLDAGAAAFGIKTQIVAWFSAQALPMAASGVLAVSVLAGPTAGPVPPTPQVSPTAAPEAPGMAEGSGTAGAQAVPAAPVMPETAEASATATPAAAVPTSVVDVVDVATPTIAIPDAPVVTTPIPAATITTTPPLTAPPAALAGASSDPATRTAPSPVPAPPGTVGAPNGETADEVAEPAPKGSDVGRPTGNGNAGTPPGQLTNNGTANGNAGTPPGQLTNNGTANGNAGTPPGQAANNGTANGNAGTPPGQAANNGTANGNAGTPPGQAANNGTANGNAGTPPGQSANARDVETPPATGNVHRDDHGNASDEAPVTSG